MALQSKTFTIPDSSEAALVFAKATAGKGIFMVDIIRKGDKVAVCIDVYGVLLTPKSTRVSCWNF